MQYTQHIFSKLYFHLIGYHMLDALRLGAGVVVAVALHQIDHTPHGKASAEGDNESLQDRDCLSDKCHRFFLLISCCF